MAMISERTPITASVGVVCKAKVGYEVVGSATTSPLPHRNSGKKLLNWLASLLPRTEPKEKHRVLQCPSSALALSGR